MKNFALLILFLFISIHGSSQIAEKDFKKIEKFENQYAANVDSIKILKNEAKLVFSHDDIFRCIHLHGKNQHIYLIEIRYIDNYRGYTEFFEDSEDYVVFKVRGDGAANKSKFLKVNKLTGNMEFIDN